MTAVVLGLSLYALPASILYAQTIQLQSPAIEGLSSHNHPHIHQPEDLLICTTIDLISSDEGKEALDQYYRWREVREDTGIQEETSIAQYDIGSTRTFKVRNLSNSANQNNWDNIDFTLRGRG
ncbi:MAG: hypothetical protein ABR545_05910, partial [Cyclonatronaceae bacterium]